MYLTEILLLIIGLLVLFDFWRKRTSSYWQNHGIPYIKPLPFIGNMKNIFTLKTSIGLTMTDFYNDPQVKNEAVVGIYILHKPSLVIREPELIKSVLIKDFNKFHNRTSACDPHNDGLGSHNLFFIKNPYWREVRTKISPVFTCGKIKQMYPLMLEIGADLEQHLASFVRNQVAFVGEVKEICANFTTDVIATIAFGIRANSLANPQAEFREHGRKLLTFTFSRAVEFFFIYFFPKLVTLFRIKIFTKEFSIFLRDSINYVVLERERSDSSTLRNDLIDILLTLKKETALEKDSNQFAISNDFLIAQAALFLTAGFESSSSTMSYALFELAKQPALQQRLRNEICEALLAENGHISYEKMNSLEYLGMVLDETLRLYPILPFLDREYSPDTGTEDSEFSLKPYYDYKLTDGMAVYIPIFALQRDEKYWHNPNTFDPERFSSANRKLHHPMTYLPFGTGPHNCIGSRIGLLQSKIGLIHILKNHYVTTCEQTVHELTFDPKALVLQSNGGIYLKIVNDRMYDIAASKK